MKGGVIKKDKRITSEKKITQKELTNGAEIDLSYLGKIERGQKNNISLYFRNLSTILQMIENISKLSNLCKKNFSGVDIKKYK